MNVTLLHHTPLWLADKAIGKCWAKPTADMEYVYHTEYGDEYTKPGPGCNTERIDRVANKNKHASTIEHVSYNFDIDGISRACLQELARHRIASISVKSSRYTLKELRDEAPFVSSDFDYIGWLTGKPGAVGSYQSKRASKYLVWTENNRIDVASVVALENLRIQLKSGIANDLAKYCMPEAYKTSMVWTVNARSLQNFLALRTSKAALWEIRDIAHAVYSQIPEDHRFLFKDSVTNLKDNNNED
jgi:thymidylate synthase (FAD)